MFQRCLILYSENKISFQTNKITIIYNNYETKKSSNGTRNNWYYQVA